MPTSKIEYKNYSSLVKQFGEDVIEDRFELLVNLYDEFIASQNLQSKIILNRISLGYAIMDYFSDISRIKEFHGIERVNDTKICAYECFWLLKRKPLQIIEATADCVFCNEQFIFLRMLQKFSNNNTNIYAIFDNSDLKPFLESLFYYIKFRLRDPQTIELAFQAFAAGAKMQEILLSQKNS